MNKVTIKAGWDINIVLVDGVEVAKFHFCRDMREVNSRKVLKCSGELTDLHTGEKTDLHRFCWMKDVRNFVKETYSKCKRLK